MLSLLRQLFRKRANRHFDAECTVSALKHRVARLKGRAGVQGTTRPKTRKSGTKRAKTMKATKEDFEKAKATAKSNKKVKVSSDTNEDNLDEDNIDNVDSSDEQQSSEDFGLEYF